MCYYFIKKSVCIKEEVFMNSLESFNNLANLSIFNLYLDSLIRVLLIILIVVVIIYLAKRIPNNKA